MKVRFAEEQEPVAPAASQLPSTNLTPENNGEQPGITPYPSLVPSAAHANDGTTSGEAVEAVEPDISDGEDDVEDIDGENGPPSPHEELISVGGDQQDELELLAPEQLTRSRLPSNAASIRGAATSSAKSKWSDVSFVSNAASHRSHTASAHTLREIIRARSRQASGSGAALNIVIPPGLMTFPAADGRGTPVATTDEPEKMLLEIQREVGRHFSQRDLIEALGVPAPPGMSTQPPLTQEQMQTAIAPFTHEMLIQVIANLGPIALTGAAGAGASRVVSAADGTRPVSPSPSECSVCARAASSASRAIAPPLPGTKNVLVNRGMIFDY